jgi:hypothetical protein
MNVILGVKQDPQHIQALTNCKLHNQGLVNLLQAKLDEAKNSLLSADEQIRFFRLQGRAQVLSDLLAAIDSAPELLNKVNR